MKKILLTQNKFALVDDEDFEYLNQWKWQIHSGGYAKTAFSQSNITKTKQIIIYMHRFLVKVPKNHFIDHIDGNPLNNQKNNLRVVTKHQNTFNKRKYGTNLTSKFKGISLRKDTHKWRTTIKYNRKQLICGNFELKHEHYAALMYDFWATELFGQFAKTNFKIVSHSSSSEFSKARV